MIVFSRDGTKVKASINTPIPNYDVRVFNFMWECGGEAYAGLLAAAMHREMHDKLKAIRADAYEKGWKDAKAKKTKETWFGSWW